MRASSRHYDIIRQWLPAGRVRCWLWHSGPLPLEVLAWQIRMDVDKARWLCDRLIEAGMVRRTEAGEMELVPGGESEFARKHWNPRKDCAKTAAARGGWLLSPAEFQTHWRVAGFKR